jgi:hypothetical protein
VRHSAQLPSADDVSITLGRNEAISVSFRILSQPHMAKFNASSATVCSACILFTARHEARPPDCVLLVAQRAQPCSPSEPQPLLHIGPPERVTHPIPCAHQNDFRRPPPPIISTRHNKRADRRNQTRHDQSYVLHHRSQYSDPTRDWRHNLRVLALVA